MRFTAKAFKRKLSRKRKQKRQRTRRLRRKQRGGDIPNTTDERLMKAGYLANPLIESDSYQGGEPTEFKA